MPPCLFPHLPRRVSWDTTVGENTGRARAGTMAEGTGGGHDTAMQPPRLLLPPSPSYPHARTALSPSLFPSSPTPGGMGRHGGGEHVEGKGGGTQPSGSGRGHRSPSAALPPPPFTLPHHHTSRATRWGLPSPLPTALLTHPGPHSFPLPSPFHSQRGGTLQWGRTRGGYGKVQGGGSVSWACTGRWYECGVLNTTTLPHGEDREDDGV